MNRELLELLHKKADFVSDKSYLTSNIIFVRVTKLIENINMTFLISEHVVQKTIMVTSDTIPSIVICCGLFKDIKHILNLTLVPKWPFKNFDDKN